MGAQDAIITTLQAPNHNSGKDEYVVDMTGHETHYWQGTESGLLGAFEFQGACTAGDGSCDMGSNPHSKTNAHEIQGKWDGRMRG